MRREFDRLEPRLGLRLRGLRIESDMAAALIVLAAAVLRFYHLGAQSLWSDEGNSAAMAARSFGRIALETAHDIHPPLYYWLLRLWSLFFGRSEAGLRSLSALAGVLTVWFVYLLGKRLYGGRAGLVAAALAALSPLGIYYSQEARMYALLALVTVAAAWFGLGDRPVDYAAMGVLVAAGLYTHYTFPIVWAPIALILPFASDAPLRKRVAGWAGAHLLAVVLFLPWLPTAWRQVTTWPRSRFHEPILGAFYRAWRWLLMGPMDSLFRSPWPWVVLALLTILGLARRSSIPRGRVLVAAWLAVPLGVILVPGLYKPAYLKFLVVAIPPWALLTAAGLDFLLEGGWAKASLSLAGVALAVALLARGDVAYFTDPKFARDDYRGIARYITALATPKDAVILDAPGQVEVFRYYYDGPAPVFLLPEQRPPDRKATEDRLAQIAATRNHIFVLYWATDESDPAGIVEGWLGRHTFEAVDSWRGNVRFVVYSVLHADLPMAPVGELFGGWLELREAGFTPRSLRAGDVLQVRFRWHALQKPDARYKITVQVLDDRWQVVAQQDGEPAGGSMPTTRWAAGQTVDDLHGVLVPFGVPPGKYRVGVAVYRADTGKRLPAPSGHGNMIFIGEVSVSRPESPPPVEILPIRHRKSARSDGVELLGFDFYKRGYGHAPDTPLHPGDLLHVELYWQAVGSPTEDMGFKLSLVGDGGKEASSVAGKIGGHFPTGRWRRGDIVRDEQDLALPAALRPGTYRLRLEFGDAGPLWLGKVRVK